MMTALLIFYLAITLLIILYFTSGAFYKRQSEGLTTFEFMMSAFISAFLWPVTLIVIPTIGRVIGVKK